MNIVIQVLSGKDNLEDIKEIRRKVFIEEQSVPHEIERDGLDKRSEHLLIKENGSPIGTLRMRFIDNKVKLERFAILKEYRRKGIGTKAFSYAMEYCKKKGVKEIYFNAQYYLLDLYKRLGFKVRGEKFIEAGIEHIQMYMNP